jgi:membrane-associated phospholipid phosphatase
MHAQTTKLGRHQKPWPAFPLLAGVFIACLIIFILLAYEVVYRHHDSFDMKVSAYFSRQPVAELAQIMRFITFFGSSFFLLPAYLVLTGYLAFKKDVRSALAVVIISFTSWLALSELKLLFHRRRPHQPLVSDITTYSFPSAHMFSSLIFFCLLAFIVSKWKAPSTGKTVALALLLLCPLAIGLSRIVLNVHYTTDVMAAFCLGTVWLLLSFVLYRKAAPGSDNHLR